MLASIKKCHKRFCCSIAIADTGIKACAGPCALAEVAVCAGHRERRGREGRLQQCGREGSDGSVGRCTTPGQGAETDFTDF